MHSPQPVHSHATSRQLTSLPARLALIFVVGLIAAPSLAQRQDEGTHPGGDKKKGAAATCDCDEERADLETAENAEENAEAEFEAAQEALTEAEAVRDEATAAVDEIVNGLSEIDGVVGDPADLPAGTQVGRFGLSGFGIQSTVYFPAQQSSSIISQITDRLEEDGVADAIEAAQDASKAVSDAQAALEAEFADLQQARNATAAAQAALDACLEACEK